MSIATSTRSKGCSDKMKAGVCPAGPCEECERLHIECLGYEPRHPPWLKVTNFHMVIICSADVDTIEKERRSHPRYQRIYEGIERGRRQVLFSRTRISQKKSPLIPRLTSDFLQFDNYYKDTDWRPHFGTKDSIPPSDEVDDAEGLSIEGGTTSEEFSSTSPVIPQAGGRPLPTPSASESGEPIFSPLSPHPRLPCQTFPMALPSFAVHPNVSSVGYPSYTSGPGSVCWAPTDSVHGHLIDHIIGEGPWPLDPPVASYPA